MDVSFTQESLELDYIPSPSEYIYKPATRKSPEESWHHLIAKVDSDSDIFEYLPNPYYAPPYVFHFVKRQPQENSWKSEFGNQICSELNPNRSDLKSYREYLECLLWKPGTFPIPELLIKLVNEDDALLSIRYLFRNSCGINIADDDTLLSIRYLFPDSDGINGGKRQRSRKHHRHGRRKRNWEK